MMRYSKRIMGIVTVMCLAMPANVCVSSTQETILAAEVQKDTFANQEGVLQAEGDEYKFSLTSKMDYKIQLKALTNEVDVKFSLVAVLKTGEKELEAGTINGTKWVQSKTDSDVYEYNFSKLDLSAGEYIVRISSEDTGEYQISGWAEKIPALNKKSVTMAKGTSKKLSVSNAKQSIAWSSTKASVVSVDKKGTITAKKKGTATIKAKVGTRTLSCNVKVTNPALNKKAFTVLVGGKQTLKITGNIGKITWKSADTKIAAVSKKGVVTTKKAGSTKITASVDGKNFVCKVTVKKNEFTAKKRENNELGYGVYFNPIKISYGSKGQVICKVQIINNSINNIAGFTNFGIKILDKKGKELGEHIEDNIECPIDYGKNKIITITIAKKELKKQNIDLRSVKTKCTGVYDVKK